MIFLGKYTKQLSTSKNVKKHKGVWKRIYHAGTLVRELQLAVVPC